MDGHGSVPASRYARINQSPAERPGSVPGNADGTCQRASPLGSGNLATCRLVGTNPFFDERMGALALIEKPLTATMESLAKTIARGTPKGSQFSLTKRLCRAEVLNMELSHGKDADHDGQSHDHELRDEKWRLRLCWGHRFHRRYFLEQLSYQYEHVQIQTDHNIY
jgi:hypothetical protein